MVGGAANGQPLISNDFTKLGTSVVFAADVTRAPMQGPGLLVGIADADGIGLARFIDAPEVQQSPEGVVFSSMRNQLKLSVSPEKLTFEDGSDGIPARDDFPHRVAGAAKHISETSGLPLAGVGLIFEVEAKPADHSLPSHAILQGLVQKSTVSRYGAIGAAVRLWYIAGGLMHSLRLEPRGNQLEGSPYFGQVHVHVDLVETPSASWLSGALQGAYDDFKRVLTDILTPEER